MVANKNESILWAVAPKPHDEEERVDEIIGHRLERTVVVPGRRGRRSRDAPGSRDHRRANVIAAHQQTRRQLGQLPRMRRPALAQRGVLGLRGGGTC